MRGDEQMKKAIIILLIALIAGSFAFADDVPKVDPVTYEDINFAYQPGLARYDAMGQSGLALPSRLDSFYTNPAALSKSGFALNLPSFSFTWYNLEKLVNDPDAVAIIERIIKGNPSDEDAITLAQKFLNNLGGGRNMIAKLDMDVSLKLGMLGLGTNVQVKIHSLNQGSSWASTSVIPEVNAAQTVALGVELLDTGALSLSAGVAVHGVYKAYYKALNGSTIVDLMKSDNIGETLLWATPVMGGYAIPFDVGVTLGLLNDTMTISATANNLNGKYHMKSFGGAGDLVNSISKGAVKVPAGHISGESVDFDVETPWSLNFGFAFAPNVPGLNPVVTADLVDMYELIRSFSSTDFRASDLLLHLNLGAELGVFNIVKVRAGVNRGYLSVGAGIWLPFMAVDATYGWQEFGKEIGDKAVDSLTIKFTLGYDKL